MGVLARRRGQRGVSLIEVLAALAILGIVTISVLGLFAQSINMNAQGQDYAVVNSLARDKLEELMALRYDDARLAIAPGTTQAETSGQTAFDPSDNPTAQSNHYAWSYTVRAFQLPKVGPVEGALGTPLDPLNGTGDVKQITVTVRSLRPLADNRVIQVSAYKTGGLL